MRAFPARAEDTPVGFVVTFISDYFTMNVEVNGQNNWTDNFVVEYAAQIIKDEYDWDVLSNCIFSEVTDAAVLERTT